MPFQCGIGVFPYQTDLRFNLGSAACDVCDAGEGFSKCGSALAASLAPGELYKMQILSVRLRPAARAALGLGSSTPVSQEASRRF